MLVHFPYASPVVITSRVFPDSAKLKGLTGCREGLCLKTTQFSGFAN